MGFPDFPIRKYKESYLTQENILDFLNNFADFFKLRQHIKVKKVEKAHKKNLNLFKFLVVSSRKKYKTGKR